MLEFIDVKYGNSFAADFRLPEGCFCGVFGEGRTELMKLAAGILAPAEGRVLQNGLALSAAAGRRRVQYLAGSCEYFPGVSAEEAARLFEALYPAFDRPAFEALLARADVPSRKSAARLSERDRLLARLALALAAGPELLILDGVWDRLADPDRTLLRELLFAALEERRLTVLADFASPEEAEKLCDRFLLLRDGRLLWEKEAWALPEEYCQAEFTGADDARLREFAGESLLSFETLGRSRLLTLRVSEEDAADRFRAAGLPPCALRPLSAAEILRREGGLR